VIYPLNFEQKIGFDKIRDILKRNCLSEIARELVDNMQFITDFNFLLEQLYLTDEFKQIGISGDDFPVSFYFDIRSSLENIKVEGTFMDLNDLYDFKRSLETVKSIQAFFKRQKEGAYPNLQTLVAGFKTFPYIFERIDAIINKFGAIKDNASPQLAKIRIELQQKLNSVSKISNSILKSAQNEGWVESDVSLAIRDGKTLIPVPAGAKRKIKGVVYDESATGKTVYIEPLEVVEINNAIRELEFAEKREIIRILVNFADDVRPYIEDLLLTYETLGQIDFIRAKSLYAIEIEANRPELLPHPITDLRSARHPHLILNFKKENRIVIPLSIELDENQRIVVISGPNAGGKSVCLKTVGLLQYMVQCGLLVPAYQTSKMGIYKNIFIDIGDEQSIENDLSTYSSHLTNMKHFVNHADANTLVLIDEFGTGTEPLMGGAIAESVLDELNQLKIKGVITTHYTNLKHFAGETSGISNGAMLFDTKKIKPLYKLEVGKPGSSFAFEIADNIGIPKQILDKAREKVGKDYIDFDRQLQEVETERRNLAMLQTNLLQKQKELEQKIDDYNKEYEYVTLKRKTILNEAQQEAKFLLNSVNKKIENTISAIKEAKAEKESTKEVRKEFEGFRQDINKQILDDQALIEAKIESLKRKQKERAKRQLQKMIDKKNEQIEIEQFIQNPEFAVGDRVKLDAQSSVGEIIDIKDNNVTVIFGQLQTTVKKERLTKATKSEVKRQEPTRPVSNLNSGFDTFQQKLNFSSGLDIRGFRGDEALRQVTDFLDKALMVQSRELKILHGKGNGILRQLIRELLQSTPFVKSYKDEHLERGGSGITIVELDI
jgi:DNA mismatch repair protein MutS2